MGKAAAHAVESLTVIAAADEDDGLGLQDVVGIAQEELESGLLSDATCFVAQPADFLSGYHTYFQYVHAFAFWGGTGSYHNLSGSLFDKLLSDFAFVGYHVYLVLKVSS